MDINEARELLQKAGVFYYNSPEELDEDDDPKDLQTLNMNDAWCWACAMGEYVPDEDLLEVARLFMDYGRCGVLYWFSERNNNIKSEFFHINRYVEFVAKEERIIDKSKSESYLAYTPYGYNIGTSGPLRIFHNLIKWIRKLKPKQC